ncbi:MAG: PhnD/SsuA/transferrin family substrate-binding protein [Planctomycetes bacterium]|nr:PhnD/SsuA/transferrin family substrate-binding protein [Planctomycetota bacterium]
MKTPARAAAAALCVLLLSPAPPRAEAAEPLQLTFGVYASDKPTDMYKAFKPVLVFLEGSMGKRLEMPVQIKLRVFNSYDAARATLVKAEIDFVRFGPSSYILAKDASPGISILAIEEQAGQYEFKGVIFTRLDTGIKSIKDLRGKAFAFGDPDSTIGRYLSQSFLVDAGIFAKDLSRFEHFDRHDRVVEAVLGGKFDAGAAKEGTFAKYKDRGLVVLETFPNITKPWVARAGLDAAVAAAVRDGLASCKDKLVLDAMGEKITGFNLEHAKDEKYEPVRVGMKKAEAFLKGQEPAPAKAQEPAAGRAPQSAN